MSPFTLAVVAIAATAVVILFVRADRRQRAARTALLAELGFRPLPPDGPPHPEPLLALYRRGSAAARLEAVFHREDAAGHLFVFDVRDPSRPRHSVLATSAVGFIRPGLRLPPFALLGRVGTGPAAELVQRMMAPLLDQLAGPGEPVPLDDRPAVAARFTARALAPGVAAAVHAALTPAVPEAMGRAPVTVVLAAGEAVALQGNPAAPGYTGGELAMLRELVLAAQALPAALGAERVAW